MSNGIIYIVTGRGDAAKQCGVSVESLRNQGCGLPVSIICDWEAHETGDLDWARTAQAVDVVVPEVAEAFPVGVWRSRFLKTQAFSLVPYYTLTAMLDCDTVVIRPVDGLFDAFPACPGCGRRNWHSANCPNWRQRMPDLVAAPDPVWPILPLERPAFLAPEEWDATSAAADLGSAPATYWNTGVLVWRRGPGAERFFAEWHEQWLGYKTYDQFAFFRASRVTSSWVLSLPRRWNTLDRDRAVSPGETTIVHFAADGAERSGRMRRLMESML